MVVLELIEKRFKEMSGIVGCDLSVFPLQKEGTLQTITNKLKSDSFGEVFTPLWLVDIMILQCSTNSSAAGKKLFEAKTPLDLCAGYGQFTIRMLRCIYNYRKSIGKNFDVYKWLNKHSFSELQFENVFKLLYIFGAHTNIYIGDACFLNTLRNNDNGLLIHNGREWLNITKEVKKKFNFSETYDQAMEQEFCVFLTRIVERKKSIQTRLFH